MPKSPTRRELLKAGAIGVAALAVPGLTHAEPMPTTEEIEKDLGHPLPDGAKKLLDAALAANRKNGIDRLKTVLPDCSEPCFTYTATGVNGR